MHWGYDCKAQLWSVWGLILSYDMEFQIFSLCLCGFPLFCSHLLRICHSTCNGPVSQDPECVPGKALDPWLHLLIKKKKLMYCSQLTSAVIPANKYTSIIIA